MITNIKPTDIEKRSFEIITELLGDRVLDPQNEFVIKRAIHTTADFDYADIWYFPKMQQQRALKPCEAAAILLPIPRWQNPASTKPYLKSLAARCIALCPTRMWQARQSSAE